VPPISPCGMAQDHLHQPYISNMRDAAGNLFPVAWVLIPDGKFPPFPTAFGSWLYNPDGKLAEVSIGEQVTEELVWSPFTSVPSRVCRDCYVGDSDWFLGDWPDGTPSVVMNPDGFAENCGGPCMDCLKSVGLAAASTFIVTGSPVVSRGTISLDWVDVPAGYALMGPTSGPDAKPTFKPLPTATPTIVADGSGIDVSFDGIDTYTVSIETGDLPSGVTLPAPQLTSGTIPSGVLLPADQLDTGTIPSGVTMPTSQLTYDSWDGGMLYPPSQLDTGTLSAGVDVPWSNISGAPPSGGVQDWHLTGTMSSAGYVSMGSISGSNGMFVTMVAKRTSVSGGFDMALKITDLYGTTSSMIFFGSIFGTPSGYHFTTCEGLFSGSGTYGPFAAIELFMRQNGSAADYDIHFSYSA